jgi:hypothetical protein
VVVTGTILDTLRAGRSRTVALTQASANVLAGNLVKFDLTLTIKQFKKLVGLARRSAHASAALALTATTASGHSTINANVPTITVPRRLSQAHLHSG